MNKQRAETRLKLSEKISALEAGAGTLPEENRGRKQFIEPEVSEAIKVLKATQFFQQFSDNGNI